MELNLMSTIFFCILQYAQELPIPSLTFEFLICDLAAQLLQFQQRCSYLNQSSRSLLVGTMHEMLSKSVAFYCAME